MEPERNSGIGEVLSAVDMRCIPVIKHDSGWSDLRLRVVGIVALRDIGEGEELMTCYHTAVNS